MYTQTATQRNTTAQTIARQMMMRRRFFMALVASIAILGGLYIFFLASTTLHIAQRKSIQSDIRLANSRIADLEAEFFTQANGVDLAYAKDLGFVEITDVHYSERTLPTESFAFHVE